MKIVIAPDSFKGSLSAKEVAQAIAAAFQLELPEAILDVVPMADGGEGTVEALVYATHGKLEPVCVQGPLGAPVETAYGILGDNKTVVIEMATICGYSMVEDGQKNPLLTTTYGIGEAMLHAVHQGYRRFLFGVGGSVTNDGGMGMLQALGVQFLDAEGNALPPVGGALARLASIDVGTLSPLVAGLDIQIATDVQNPLCGPKGASYIFGPQKGASSAQVEVLDAGLAHYADLIEDQQQRSFRDMPGAGAGGGMGFALLALGGRLQSGARLVAEAAGLAHRMLGADWVITGEGRSDSQTLSGKAPFFVAELARQAGTKAVLLSGGFGEDCEPLYDHFVSCHSIARRPLTLEECIKNAEQLLFEEARNVARLIKATRS